MADRTDQLRTCTDTAPRAALPPRPRPPVQRLTARPLPHDLWSADRYDGFDAARAFGDDLPGGAA